MLNKKLRITLNNISQFYINKYKLKTRFSFCSQKLGTGYDILNDTVWLNYEENRFHYKLQTCQDRFKYKNFKEFIIFVLLHEIKHVLDYKKNPEQFLRTCNNQTTSLMFLDIPYHQLPLEKRADSFAKKEIKKYV
jgi:hypothetical protein